MGTASPKETRTRPESLARLEGEPHRHDHEASRRLRLVAERDPCRARLDPLHARLRVGGAFGIDGDEPAAVEGLMARRERLHVPIHRVGIVLFPVDGDHTGCDEEPRDERFTKEGGGREIVHLPREHRPHQQRVDQVVRMVDAEEHGPRQGHSLRVPDLDALEEEPYPESRDGPHERIEAVHRLGRDHRGAVADAGPGAVSTAPEGQNV